MGRGAPASFVVAVLVGVGCWQAPGVVRSAYHVARDGAATSRMDRQLLPAHVVGIGDTSVFPRLASLMPPRSTYTVSISSDAPPGELAGGYVTGWLNYWLQPRRLVPITGRPDFEIFFGSVPKLRHARKVAAIGAGITLVRDR